MKSIITLLLLFIQVPFFAQTVDIDDSGDCYIAGGTNGMTLNLTGNDGGTPLRNIYSGVQDFGATITVIWNSGNSRWELQYTFGGTFVDFVNTAPTAPNPPELGVGTWSPIGGTPCGVLIQFEGSGTQLPVELISFEVNKLKENKTELRWSTASETNNEGFDIEHSIDGQSWRSIGFETGKGTTNEKSNYSFIDRNPAPGHNYYRLKQMDFDGRFEYSDVQMVLMESNGGGAVSIFPNPSKGQFTISLHNLAQQDARIQLLNITGQLIWEQNFDASSANEFWTQEMDLPKGGFYFLVSQVGSEVRTEKVFVE